MDRSSASAGFAILIACALAASLPVRAASHGRSWTLDDVLTVPLVTDLALTRNGRQAAYVVRTADPGDNQTWADLYLVDLDRRSTKKLLRAATIERLRQMPGTTDWSALVDLGQGVQLYRIDSQGSVTPILASGETVRVGNADQAVSSLLPQAVQAVGILSYEWSPDGLWLWYSVFRKLKEPPSVRFDEQVEAERDQRRQHIDAEIELHLRSNSGADILVAARPSNDRIARYLGGNVSWSDGEVHYHIEHARPDGSSSFATMAWKMEGQQSRPVEGDREYHFTTPALGPHGGRLETSGFGESRRLVETMADGSRHDHGRAAFLIGDPRSAGNWRAANGRLAIVGTRMLEHPQYGLELVGRDRRQRIATSGSLTKCDFRTDLSRGVCIRESLTQSPELVLVEPGKRSIRRVISVSPRHDEIEPLRVTPRIWTNQFGYLSTGFIVRPRHFVPGQRYPAIIVTHGSDADERFANPNFQWNYPVQLFAERGYFVLMINDPAPSQDARLMAAYDAWGGGGGPPAPEEVQRLVWLNGVASFEKAIHEMVAQGIIDPGRVGIAGYSRGSQMVNVAMTQSSAFRAASSGDGGFLEPSVFPHSVRSYQAIFGGSPYGPALGNYLRLSPSLRASRVSGAILQQMAAPLSGALDFDRALKACGIPTQISLYPGEDPTSDETHIFHIPSNRLLAMRENLAWFDFWLLGRKAPEMTSAERVSEWTRMANAPPAAACH